MNENLIIAIIMKIILTSARNIAFLLAAALLPAMSLVPATAQERSNAEVDPFQSQYFHNRYLGDPAMAGVDPGLRLNAAYRQQFNGIPGAPVTQAFSADYNPGKRVGLGLIAFNDKAGLINSTRMALTYAYHLPIGAYGQVLHFGISGAFAHHQLDPKGIVGDQSDPAIAEFNGKKNAFEVDYGMAYTDQHITLQASLVNLVDYMKHFNNTTADVATLYAAAAYRFTFKETGAVNSLEPEVAVRGIKNYNSIVDAGANLVMFHRILNIYGMYHTSGTFSTGVGLNYKDLLYLEGSYLSKPSGLADYTDGNFEIDLTITLFGSQQHATPQ